MAHHNLHEQRFELPSKDELRLYCTSPIQTNTYAWISAGECMVVDPGDEGDQIARLLSDVHVVLVVATHGHNDHVSGVGKLVAATGAPFAMAAPDVSWALSHAGRPDHFGFAYGSPLPEPDRLLREKDIVSVGRASFVIIAAPGHTPGGIVLLGSKTAAGYAFVGDTIFLGSHGRCDLAGGDEDTMATTLQRLAKEIPGKTVLLCGHGSPTTMQREIETTPFYR